METVTRVAGEICSTLELDMGLGADCHYLMAPIEDAVRSCLADAPHVERHDLSSMEQAQAAIIRDSVVAVLGAQRVNRELLAKLGGDIERAAFNALRGEPSLYGVAGVG